MILRAKKGESEGTLFPSSSLLSLSQLLTGSRLFPRRRSTWSLPSGGAVVVVVVVVIVVVVDVVVVVVVSEFF